MQRLPWRGWLLAAGFSILSGASFLVFHDGIAAAFLGMRLWMKTGEKRFTDC